VLSAEKLRQRHDGEFVRAVGCAIARQRPGTAKGFIFISMGDETAIANVIVTPDRYERNRLVVTRSKFLLVENLSIWYFNNLQAIRDCQNPSQSAVICAKSGTSAERDSASFGRRKAA
jgi:DNA polymerase III alpha subunit